MTGPLYAFEGKLPELGDAVFVAPNAAVIGHVVIGEGSSIWFSAVVRGDEMPVLIARIRMIAIG